MLRPYITTNSLVHYVAAVLTAVWPISLVDRIVAAFLIFSLPFSAWLLAHRYNLANPWLLLALIPFGFSFTLITGNYNTLAGLSFAMLASATLARYDGRISWRQGMLPLALFLWFATWAHPLGLAIACLFTGTMLGFQQGPTLIALARQTPRRLCADAAERLLPVVLAYLPAFAMATIYIAFYSHAQMDENQPLAAVPFLHRLQNLLGLHQLYATIQIQVALCVGMSATVCVSVLLAIRQRGFTTGKRPDDVLLLLASTTALVVLFAPNNIAGSDYLIQRLDGLPAMLLIAWTATVPVSRRVQEMQVASVVLLSTAFIITNSIGLARTQADEAAYLDVMKQVQPGSTVLAINAGRIPEKNEDFLHPHHLVSDRLSATMLNNWNAHNPGFPIQFVPSHDPYRFFAPFRLDYHDLSGYERAAGQLVDYVFIWDKTNRLNGRAAAAPLLCQLAENYDLVAHTDTKIGYSAVLYLRRPGHGSVTGTLEQPTQMPCPPEAIKAAAYPGSSAPPGPAPP